MITISFEAHETQTPALLAAVEEISDTLATRAEGKFTIPQEAALTRGIAALSPLRLAVAGAVRAIAEDGAKRGQKFGQVADSDFPRERR